MLIVAFLYCYAECHYAKCSYTECRGAIPGKPFQPSLMLAGRPGTYPRVEHLKGASFEPANIRLG